MKKTIQLMVLGLILLLIMGCGQKDTPADAEDDNVAGDLARDADATGVKDTGVQDDGDTVNVLGGEGKITEPTDDTPAFVASTTDGSKINVGFQKIADPYGQDAPKTGVRRTVTIIGGPSFEKSSYTVNFGDEVIIENNDVFANTVRLVYRGSQKMQKMIAKGATLDIGHNLDQRGTYTLESVQKPTLTTKIIVE